MRAPFVWALLFTSCATTLALRPGGTTPKNTLTPLDLRVERLTERDAVGIDTSQPLLSWSWGSSGDASRGALVPSVHVQVAMERADLEDEAALLWNWQQPASPAPNTLSAVRYSGPPLSSTTRVYWRVCTLEGFCGSASFVTGQLSQSDWSGAQWISGRQLRSPEIRLPKDDTIKSAILAISGLGFYEATLNGVKVGDAVLDPGFSTNYTERLLYATYDVTNDIRNASSMVLAARVGAGKYSYSVNPFAVPGKDLFALLAQLKVEFSDGTLLTLGTNSSWQTSVSPIVWENLYNGEVYDARLEPEDGWAAPGYSTNSLSKEPQRWEPAKEIDRLPVGADAVLSARLFPPIRITERVTPVNKTQIGPHSFFWDLGNNFAGVAHISFGAGFPFEAVKAGAKMTVVCTEYLEIALNASGPADLYNQQDLYIFSGKERVGHSYAPTFVYHGFRYIRVDLSIPVGYSAVLSLSQNSLDATGLYMHSDVKQHGSLSVGDELSDEGKTLDAIHKMVVQTQRDNIHSVPTDCPQREKRGWMGDASWTAEEASLNFDMSALYANWIRTMNDLLDVGCTIGTPDSHGHLNMSGYCWHYAEDGGAGQLQACNLTNSYCCLPTPPGANKLYPEISFCSPQYNQTDTRGSIPDVVPNNWGRGGSRGWPGAPTWSSAFLTIPGVMLQYGADKALAETHYEGLAAHTDFLARQARYGSGVPQFGMLGDWCAIEPFCPGSSDGCLKNPGWTSGDATSAFYFVKDLEVMIQMAHAVGKTADVTKYTTALAHARMSYHAVFYNTSADNFGPTQTGNALGILASPHVEPGAVRQLLASINQNNGHLSTGGVGSRWILQALTAANQTEAALELATQKTAPSWFWFTENGPGTLHENWPKGATPDGTTAGSLNHPMFGGGVDVWIYHEVAGLRAPIAVPTVAGPTLRFGVESVIMRRVGAASACSKISGNSVSSSWRFDSESARLTYNLTVPVGVRAHVTIPTVPDRGLTIVEVQEAGKLIWSSTTSASETSHALLGLGSVERRQGTAEEELAVPVLVGHYSFTAMWERSEY